MYTVCLWIEPRTEMSTEFIFKILVDLFDVDFILPNLLIKQ